MHVISCTHPTRRSGPAAAVSGLDRDVAAGQVYGFPGPDGAGKTTTIGMLPGPIAPPAAAGAGCWPPSGCPSGQPGPPPSRRHLRAPAAAEDTTGPARFRVTPRMPGRRYLRRTDLPGADDSRARGTSHRYGGLT